MTDQKSLIIKNTFITITDGDLNVSFSGGDIFAKYTLQSSPLADEVIYKPEENIHYEITAEKKTDKEIPNAVYDEMILDIQVYLDRISDPYYGLDEQTAREKIFEEKKKAIILKKIEKNVANFSYNGNEYVSDMTNIVGVRLVCVDMPLTDKIPTFIGEPEEGSWAVEGNIFVPYTVEEFIIFAKYYHNHLEKNFTNYKRLTQQLTTSYYSESTFDEIRNFSIEEGWD